MAGDCIRGPRGALWCGASPQGAGVVKNFLPYKGLVEEINMLRDELKDQNPPSPTYDTGQLEVSS